MLKSLILYLHQILQREYTRFDTPRTHGRARHAAVHSELPALNTQASPHASTPHAVADLSITYTSSLSCSCPHSRTAARTRRTHKAVPALERRAGMYRGYDSVIRSMEEGVDPPAASVCANHPHSDMARATPLTGSLKDPRGRRCQARKTLAQEAAARRCYSKVSGPSWPLGALGGNWLWVGIVGSRIKLGERGLGGKQHSGHGRLGAHL